MGIAGAWELQKAIFDTLDGDTTLSGMVTGVYDHVGEGSTYPYVSIGECAVRDWSSLARSGVSLAATIHVWSREGGRKESLAIMERIYTLLHEEALTVTGYTLVMMRFDSSDTALEADGVSYHGIVRFKALLEKE